VSPAAASLNVVLLGAPGAGKGTQGALLTAEFGLVRISTGDLLREALRAGTPLGQAARRYMDAGELVPDDVILGLVREAMKAPAHGFIFDGFPRTLAQARALDALLAETDARLDAVLVIDVPDETLVRRLSGRRSCPNCGAIFNVYLDPPRQPGVCDRCGGTLMERADDEPATVRRRLQVYHRQTQPLVDYYQASPVPVVFIDGDRPIDAVSADAKEALKR
jgi:adenylate kinase